MILKALLKKKSKLMKHSIADIIRIKNYETSEEKKNAILLSGGIDSTLVAQMLQKRKIKSNLIINSYSADVKFKIFLKKSLSKKNLKKNYFK